jgi:hypothetical protein
MKVFERGAELIGDERAKEIEESLWYREMLTVEMTFGEEEMGEIDWSLVDGREVGMYWELNDGIGKEFGLADTNRYRKDRYGWSKLNGYGKYVVVKCGEMFDELGVCMCARCEQTVNPYMPR